MSPVAPVLSARALDVARGDRPLLRGVDLDLASGESVAILGPNGVGKSTLVAVLAGLIAPAGGSVSVTGRVAAALQSPALARRSVRANLELALGWWGVPRTERRGRADDALDLLRIGHLAARRADRLSGGESRRVHLARAFALQPDVLLLDEPFAGLDPPGRAALLRDVTPALRDRGRATLIVLHDRSEAWALADRVVVLLDGAVAADGSPAAILERPPTPGVARFLGFSGRIPEGDHIRYVRPSHVAADPAGDIVARVGNRIPEEDQVLLEATVPGGHLQVRVPYPGPGEGATLRLRLTGGVRYPANGAAP